MDKGAKKRFLQFEGCFGPVTTHEALIGAVVGMSQGPDQLRSLTSALKEDHQILSVSSIYQISSAESFETLSVVYKIKSEFEPKDLLQYLLEYEQKLKEAAARNFLQFYLLSHGQNVAITMKINLPHPEFHLKPELLLPAREIWGEYEHPVLGKTLSELAEPFVNQNWGRFYMQGSSLY